MAGGREVVWWAGGALWRVRSRWRGRSNYDSTGVNVVAGIRHVALLKSGETNTPIPVVPVEGLRYGIAGYPRELSQRKQDGTAAPTDVMSLNVSIFVGQLVAHAHLKGPIGCMIWMCSDW